MLREIDFLLFKICDRFLACIMHETLQLISKKLPWLAKTTRQWKKRWNILSKRKKIALCAN